MPVSSSPLVSIVITVYRRDRFLKDAIRSALTQTYRDVEVIVAEDGDSNCAAEIVSAADDRRLQLCRAGKRMGEAGNRVAAYRMAQGKYFVNLDDDDVLRPDFVEKLIIPLERHPSAVVAFCDHYVTRADGVIDHQASDECTRLYRRHRLAPGFHKPLHEFGVTSGTIPMNVGAMFRERLVFPNGRDAPAALPVEAAAADDLYLYYLVCISGGLAYYLPERLSEYRIHDDQLTSLRLPETSDGFLYCYRHFIADRRLRRYRRSLKLALARSMTCSGFDLLRSRERSAARRRFGQSVANAVNVRSLTGLVLSILPADTSQRFLATYRKRGHSNRELTGAPTGAKP